MTGGSQEWRTAIPFAIPNILGASARHVKNALRDNKGKLHQFPMVHAWVARHIFDGTSICEQWADHIAISKVRCLLQYVTVDDIRIWAIIHTKSVKRKDILAFVDSPNL